MEEDVHTRYVEKFELSSKPHGQPLCILTFKVRQVFSERDQLYVTEVEVKHNQAEPHIMTLKFQVFRGVPRTTTIDNVLLPPSLRGHRLSIFVFHKIYGYLNDKVRQSLPMIRGALVEKDSSPNRDKMYHKLIGYGVDPKALFDIDATGEGRFEGIFHDVGLSWQQSLTVTLLHSSSPNRV